MRYTVPFGKTGFSTAAVANTFKTAAAVIVPDAALVRARITGFHVATSDPTPVDASVMIQLARILDLSAGGAGTKAVTIAASSIPKNDPAGPDSTCSGGAEYSVEPTAYESNPYKQIGMNGRGIVWSLEEGEDPLIGTQDMLLGLLVAPRSTTVVKLTGYLEFEVF